MARVLIVEDSPANMKLARLLLLAAGHTPLEAATAIDGVELARRELPDLFLMDMQLPDMHGLDAARRLKDDARAHAIPIVAVTASAMKGDKERMLKGGCDAYIKKPISHQVFLAAVDAACGPNH